MPEVVLIQTEHRMVVIRGWGRAGGGVTGNYCSMKTKFLFREIQKKEGVWKRMVVMHNNVNIFMPITVKHG